MGRYGFTLDDKAFLGQIKVLSVRDSRIAATWAMNDAARDAFGDPKRLPKIAAHIEKVFDRPTNFATSAFYMRGARPAALEVLVEEKPSVGRKHFMKVQQTGGPRSQTGLEKRLSLASRGAAFAVIPGDAAKLDAYGNWSRGERNRVMSALQVQRDVGVKSNQSEASAKRAVRLGRDRYFVPKHGLPPGIYKRDRKGEIGVIAIFTDKVPRYGRRLNFHEKVRRDFYDKLPAHLSRTISSMVGRRAMGR